MLFLLITEKRGRLQYSPITSHLNQKSFVIRWDNKRQLPTSGKNEAVFSFTFPYHEFLDAI